MTPVAFLISRFTSDLLVSNSLSTSHLKERDFSVALFKQTFSAIHRDLITKILNGQMNWQIGPRASCFRTNVDTVTEFSDQPHVCDRKNIPQVIEDFIMTTQKHWSSNCHTMA